MLKNTYRYTKTIIDIERFLKDTTNRYRYVAKRPFKGKYDADGKEVIAPGTIVTLSVTEDQSEPIIDKETGEEKDNNLFETFDVTIVGMVDIPFKKGDFVSLSGFLPDISYYVNYTLIMRFTGIKAAEEPKK